GRVFLSRALVAPGGGPDAVGRGLHKKSLSFMGAAPAVCRHPASSEPLIMPDPFVYKSDRIRVLFGRGSAARLGEEAEHLDMARVVLLCSQNRGELARRIGAPLGPRMVGVCDASRPGMPVAAFDAIVAELQRLRADGFVCIGGRSPLRLAQAVAAAAPN